MKYGLMSYAYTTNLGNEIQSIAARRFLPEIDYYIDHEKLNLFNSPDKVKMIMNGWYLDCLKSWPPSKSIDPLLISMHFNTSFNNTKDIINTKESREFFETYGPVGCRDYATLDLLKQLDIDAYYSGCLTLTLENNQKKESDYKYIVVNSTKSNEIIEFLKTKTNMDIYDLNQESIWSFDRKYLDKMPTSYKLTSFYNIEEKFFIGENILDLYENATCVITDRLHCAFPCLALKTPVLFIDTERFAPERLKGIKELVLKSSLDEYKNDFKIFNVEKPPKNPENYKKIRKSLIKKTKEFTGYIRDSYSSNFSKEYTFNNQLYLLTKTALQSRDYMKGVIRLSKRYESKISKLQKEKKENTEKLKEYESLIASKDKIINQQKKHIEEMEKSSSWKLTKPLRDLKIGLKK